jgi:hypothetical protein
VEAGAARGNMHGLDLLEYLLGGGSKSRLQQFAARHPLLQGLRDSPRLLMYLLEHEVAVLAAFHGIGRQVAFAHRSFDARARAVNDLDRLAANFSRVAFFQEHEAARDR